MSIKVGQYRKLIAYVGGVALTYLTQKYANDPTATSWLPLVVAVGGAYGVYAAPNDSPEAELTKVMGEAVHNLPEPTHLHIHLDTTGTAPAPIQIGSPPHSYGGSAGSGGVGGGGGGGSAFAAGGPVVTVHDGSGGVGSTTDQPPANEFFESNTPDSQPGSSSAATETVPKV